jgi:hypothetical protein
VPFLAFFVAIPFSFRCVMRCLPPPSSARAPLRDRARDRVRGAEEKFS